jgi:predicted dehydrogenase
MRVAMIEVSHWHAPMYAEALSAMNATVAAVSDRDSAAAGRLADRLRCRAFTSYDGMLREVRPDFVFAFGHHREMPAIARTLIRERIPFAMEKPMGTCARDVEDIERLAAENGIFVAVPFVLRYSPVKDALNDLQNEGRFGMVTNAYFRFIAGPPSRYLEAGSPWLLDPVESGGGCTINLGVHFIDLFLSLIEPSRVTSVFALPSRMKYAAAVEDFSTVVMTAENGAVCTVETGYAYPSDPAHSRHIEYCLTTTKGYLEVREGALSWAGHDGSRFEREISTNNDLFYPLFIRRTLDDVSSGRRPAASCSHMARVMRVIDAVYQSGADRQAVSL